MSKRTPGLYKQGKIWHVRKTVCSRPISTSLKTSDLQEAERRLAVKIKEIEDAEIYGIRPKYTFREAATKYLKSIHDKKSKRNDIREVALLEQFIGDVPLQDITMATLEDFINHRKHRKNRTTNYGLTILKNILKQAAKNWKCEITGKTWIPYIPEITLLPQNDARLPRPLDEEEVLSLCNELPPHLRLMFVFAVNTGCREQEICNLQWTWEKSKKDLGPVFVIPGEYTKNGLERTVVLNQAASFVVGLCRNNNSAYVFTYNGKKVARINNSAWKKAVKRVGCKVRVHDLRHTFGRQIADNGAPLEYRKMLLGHKDTTDVTLHYSPTAMKESLKYINFAYWDSETLRKMMLKN